MNDKKKVKEYIKLYKKLIKNNAFGAAGYSEWRGPGFSDLEIAARYLAMKGYPVSVTVQSGTNLRTCNVTITTNVIYKDNTTIIRLT